MENTLANTAQMVMDLYYQSLKSEEDYFELEHFIFCCRAAYSKLVQAESDRARQYAKADEGFFVINLSQDWLIEEKVTFTKSRNGTYKGKLSQLVFAFPFDKIGYGVQSVEQIDSDKEYIRIAAEEKWKYIHMPTTRKTFYYVRGNEIALLNRQKSTLTEDCIVWYAPDLAGDPEKALIPTNKQMDVVTISLGIMKQAAQGAIVNTSNNQNTNEIIQSEIDKETLK